MLQQVKDLEREAHLPLTPALAQKYETLDSICCRCEAMAEKKCRWLRVGQVAFSPQLQQARRDIAVWRLLLRKKKGMKASSHLLQRLLQKTFIDPQVQQAALEVIKSHLATAYKSYYNLKRSHTDLRQTALDELAEAVAIKSDTPKAAIIKVLRQWEQQRNVAKKLCYLRGRINTCSTVTISIPDGPNQ
jgi:hypothetical protein